MDLSRYTSMRHETIRSCTIMLTVVKPSGARYHSVEPSNKYFRYHKFHNGGDKKFFQIFGSVKGGGVNVLIFVSPA